MATTKVTDILNFDDSGIKLAPGLSHGRIRIMQGTFAFVAAVNLLADNDILVLGRVPSNGRPISFEFSNTDLATTSFTVNVGMHEQDDTEMDEDAFDLDLDLAAANARVDVLIAIAATRIDQFGRRFWEWAGLTSDPVDGRLINITLKNSALPVLPLDGTMSWQLTYAVD